MGNYQEKQKATRRSFIKNCTAFGAGVLVWSFRSRRRSKYGRLYKDREGEKKPQVDPPVRIPDVSIRMRSPDSLLVGVTTSEIIEIKLKLLPPDRIFISLSFSRAACPVIPKGKDFLRQYSQSPV